MLLEAETNKYCPGGYDIGAISSLITWVLNFFLSAYRSTTGAQPGIERHKQLSTQSGRGTQAKRFSKSSALKCSGSTHLWDSDDTVTDSDSPESNLQYSM